MTERPILFNGEMVRAILDGRKTVTRRSVRLPRARDSFVLLEDGSGWWPYQSDDGESHLCNDGNEYPYSSPYGMPGDRLWVREAHAFVPEPAYRCSTGVQQQVNPGDDYQACIYREGFDRSAGGIWWRPSIHMPRWASRILLEVTDIRVERLHEITIGQICKEGLARSMYEFIPVTTAFDVFAELWNSTGGDWDANPWVWVIEFKRIES